MLFFVKGHTYMEFQNTHVYIGQRNVHLLQHMFIEQTDSQLRHTIGFDERMTEVDAEGPHPFSILQTTQNS